MYDAFISYRHTPLDQFVAQNLHKKLEAFRLPASLVRQRGKDCKKKIERVFRDRDELPLATNLADPITQALQESEFLIVICSPRLPQSQWCRKEIETFIEMHGRERILAVLIEGEPEDSFPEELLYRDREVTQEDGSVRIIREPVEPLAADVRGKTKKEILKAMDGELLRLAAAMFGCTYDDLKQRHKEQKMKRMLTFSFAVSSIFLVFGTVSAAMAFRIQKQKEQIQLQSDEIAGQKEQIEIQYREALENQSRSLAEKSLGLLEEGDRLGAVETALEAFREKEDGTPMPVTSEAQYALAESTYVYRNGYGVIPQYMLKHDSDVTLMVVSPNGELLLSGDNIGNLYVWRVKENKLQLRLTTDTSLILTAQERCTFLTDSMILYPTVAGYNIYDLEKEEILLAVDTFYYRSVKVSPDQKRFAVATDDSLSVYDMDTLQICCSYDFPEGTAGTGALLFDEEQERIFFGREPRGTSGTAASDVLAMHIPDGTIEREFPLEFVDVEKLLCDGDTLYVGATRSIRSLEEKEDIFSDYPGGIIYSLNLQDGSQNWKYEYEEGWVNGLVLSEDENSPNLLVLFYSDAVFLDPDKGTQKQCFHYGNEIVRSFVYKGQDAYAVLTRNGGYWYLNGDNDDTIQIASFFQANSTNVKDCNVTEGGFVLLAYSSNQITCLDQIPAPGQQEVWGGEKGFSEVTVNDAETRMLVRHAAKEVSLVDLESEEILAELSCEDGIEIAGFVGDGTEYFYCGDKESVSLYYVEDGSVYQSYPLSEYFWYNVGRLTKDRTHLLLWNTTWSNSMSVDLLTGEMEEFDLPINWEQAVKVAVGNTLSVYAVADHVENCVMLYRIGSDQSYASLPANGSYVSDLLFTKDDRYLLVVYRNKNIDVFDLETQSLVTTLDNLGTTVEGIVQAEGQEGCILRGNAESYVVDEQWNVIARVQSFVGVMPQRGKYFITRSDILYTLPIYSLDMLIEEGERILTTMNVVED